MNQERRSSPRVRAYLPLRLRTPGTPQTLETLTKDLSLGGVRCISPTVCPVSTEVGLELILATGDEPLALRGKTAWFRTIPESDQFDFGIVFVELSPQNKRRLSVYIERLANKSGLVPA